MKKYLSTILAATLLLCLFGGDAHAQKKTTDDFQMTPAVQAEFFGNRLGEKFVAEKPGSELKGKLQSESYLIDAQKTYTYRNVEFGGETWETVIVTVVNKDRFASIKFVNSYITEEATFAFYDRLRSLLELKYPTLTETKEFTGKSYKDDKKRIISISAQPQDEKERKITQYRWQCTLQYSDESLLASKGAKAYSEL